MHDTTPQQGLLEVELLAYLDAHPQAADTAEGIAQWWLVSTRGPDPVMLGQVLGRLVAAGRLSQRTSPDGRVIYAGCLQPMH